MSGPDRPSPTPDQVADEARTWIVEHWDAELPLLEWRRLLLDSGGRPPRLFHKADLGPGPELPAAVSDALADPQQRVVGVVHNAVDVQLAGSDQMELTWSAEILRPLPALLRIARDGGAPILRGRPLL